jgi:hypothetical protein
MAYGCMIMMKWHMPLSQTKERAHVCTLLLRSLVLGWNAVACLATPSSLLAARKAISAARVTPANMVFPAASGSRHVSTPPPHLVAARNIRSAAARVAAAFMVLSARRINVYRAPLLLLPLLHLPLLVCAHFSALPLFSWQLKLFRTPAIIYCRYRQGPNSMRGEEQSNQETERERVSKWEKPTQNEVGSARKAEPRMPDRLGMWTTYVEAQART